MHMVCMQIINKFCVSDQSCSDKGFETVFLPCEVLMKSVPAGVKVASADITTSLAFQISGPNGSLYMAMFCGHAHDGCPVRG
jgi:hypothetical protein